MTATITAIIIAAIPGLLAWLQSCKNTSRIQEIHVLFNSRLDELLRAHGLAERAAGVQQEREESRDRATVKVEVAEARADKLASEVPRPPVTMAPQVEQPQAKK
jgi:hypothetical protein